MVSEGSLVAGFDSETDICLGLGVTMCNNMVGVKNTYGLHAKSKDLASQRVTRTRNSFTRHVTWSFQTAGPSLGADSKERTPPGPMSDMFLVPIEIVSFYDTFNITQAGECAANISQRFLTFTLPQNNSAGIGWYSRHHIINHVIPSLRLMVLQSDTLEKFITVLGHSASGLR